MYKSLSKMYKGLSDEELKELIQHKRVGFESGYRLPSAYKALLNNIELAHLLEEKERRDEIEREKHYKVGLQAGLWGDNFLTQKRYISLDFAMAQVMDIIADSSWKYEFRLLDENSEIVAYWKCMPYESNLWVNVVSKNPLQAIFDMFRFKESECEEFVEKWLKANDSQA